MTQIKHFLFCGATLTCAAKLLLSADVLEFNKKHAHMHIHMNTRTLSNLLIHVKGHANLNYLGF